MTLNRRRALLTLLAALVSLSAAYATLRVLSPGIEQPLVAVGRSDLETFSLPRAEDASNRHSFENARVPPSLPKTVDEARAEVAAAKKPPAKWSDADIADGKARCAAILKRIHAVAIAHTPIKQGACGAPAPIELVSIGENPQVTLSPPAIVTCSLAEGLATWLEESLQPLAQKLLSSPIIAIKTMSSYSCRNAYGRKQSKISEHGFANALDIRGFVTGSAKTAEVLADWGTPQREIAERITAQKQAAAIAVAGKAAPADVPIQPSNSKSAATERPAISGAPALAGFARSTIVDSIPKMTAILPGLSSAAKAPSLSIAEPDRLGGPTPPDDIATKPGRDGRPDRHRAEREFLHRAHASACRIFGTTLGPEANAAHRNHIHVDMAQRPTMKICE